MLSTLVVKLYTALLEICLWLMLLFGFFVGYNAYGFMGGLGGLLAAAAFGAVFFGAFLVLNDMRARLETLESQSKIANTRLLLISRLDQNDTQ